MKPLVLLTGATGYIGGRLLRLFEAEQHPVRCLARRPDMLRGQVTREVEVVEGDLLDAASLPRVLEGVNTAYYLVHSMARSQDFEETDRRAASGFGAAARAAGVRRIVYLGGLGDSSANLSPHLRSRQEVGEILRQSGVPVVEFRASIVIGSGSLSFEMIRALVERLPIMITPRWVTILAQPISIDDVLQYLRAALDLSISGSPIYEIGGPDRLSYGSLMREYARQRGLHRLMISVPALTPRLSSLWLALVTPLYASIGRKLVDSIRHPTVVQNDAALRTFPIRPIAASESIACAIRNEDFEFDKTRWSGLLSSSRSVPRWGGVRFGNRLVDSRKAYVPLDPSAAFVPIRRIGGANGWYFSNWIWTLRGWFDRLIGGIGMRRGRPDREQLKLGDTIDYWRVAIFEPDRRLRLVAEMKVPGRAWLEFEVTQKNKGALIHQTAVFDPVGLFGLLYWYAAFPIHRFVFGGMLRRIARIAQDTSSRS